MAGITGCELILENTLAAAMIDVDIDDGSLFNPSQREALKSLLTERDELITLLARSDPSATERLFAVYSTYNKVANKRG